MANLAQEKMDEIVQKVITSIENNETGIWNKSWIGSSLPMNHKTQTSYSGFNTLALMLMQHEMGFSSSEWLTFNQIKFIKGAHLKKGSESTPVFFFKILEKEETVNGKKEKKTIPLMKFYYVYNLDQIEGIKIGTEKAQNEDLNSFVSKCNVEIKTRMNAYYSPKSDYIGMPDLKVFKTTEGYASTLCHELIHSSGHESRLDRDMSGEFGSENYSFEEVTAELGSMFLMSLLGVLSRKSVKETLLLASTIITYANRHKKLNIINQFNIIRGDKLYIKVNNVKPRYLTKEEIKNYLAEVKYVTENDPEKHNYLYLISLLALSTAARRDTILSIRIEDIDLENDNLQLRNFKTESNFTSTISNPTIKNEIIRIIDNRPASSFLFENPATGLRISTFPPKMKEILDYTVNCHKSYLNHLTIKEFRNTVASHLAMNGSSLPQIAQVLNHTSVRSTEIYTQLRPSTAKDKVADFVSEYLD